jgi:hypothetical protein
MPLNSITPDTLYVVVVKKDVDWNTVKYFISDLEEVSDYLEANK